MVTGFMSNRGRQFVASYIIVDLGLDWRIGAELFESFLIDYDVHANWGNWMRAAGGSGPNCSNHSLSITTCMQTGATGCELLADRGRIVRIIPYRLRRACKLGQLDA